MEKPRYRMRLLIICYAAILLLGTTAFSCCVAAEFKKVKAKDMKLDGSLCSFPRSPAFGLGIAALVCLSVVQIVGTSAAATRLFTKENKSSRNQIVSIMLLVLSWVSFGLAAILLGTGSSMNNRQEYGRGWLNGQCYVIKDGVYIGAAVLTAATVIFIIGFTFTTRKKIQMQQRTGPDEERSNDHLHEHNNNCK